MKKNTAADSAARLRWFKEARFGMFITWGLYSQLGRWEWTMHNERIPIREYEKLADAWRTKPRPMREWARLARAAGMKYMFGSKANSLRRECPCQHTRM